MAQAFIGLGSNKDNRLSYLFQAVTDIGRIKTLQRRRISSIYETEPVGKKDQRNFLNAVLEVLSDAEPIELLDKLLYIENSLGRTRTMRWGPRTIDLDLLSVGQYCVADSRLHIPHPELTKRRFVLIPFNEIAADYVVPGIAKTVSELMSECPDTNRVTLFMTASVFEKKLQEVIH